MGDRILVEQLVQRSNAFFAKVTRILTERNLVRGDSYLDMDLEDFLVMIKDKCNRVRASTTIDMNKPRVRSDLADSVHDIAGYSSLLALWLVQHGYMSEEDFTSEVPTP